MGKTRKSTIKDLENTYTKSRRLKFETGIKMDDCFTISQHKTKEPKKV